MSTYNTVIKKRNAQNNGWDSILPMTTAENVLVDSEGKSVADHVDDFVMHPGDGGTTAGTATAYTCASLPAPIAYTDRMGLIVKVHADSGVNPTINWNGLGAKAIKKPNGNAAILKSGGIYTLRYNATTEAFILQGEGASGNATASDLLSGKTASTDAGDITGNIPIKSAATYTPTASNQTIPAGQYLSGTQTILGDADLVSANIKAGKNIFGVAGNANVVDTSAGDATAAQILNGRNAYVKGGKVIGTMPNHSATPHTTGSMVAAGVFTSGNPNSRVYVKPAEGYYNGEVWSAFDMPDLVPQNVKSGITIGGDGGSFTGTFTSDATATSGHILSGKSAYVAGNKVTGTIPSKAAAIYTPSTVNQTISSGYYLSGNQTIAGDADLVSANIKAGKNIFGVAGNANVVDTSAGDATAAQILSGRKAYVDGALVTGTIPSRGAATITPSTVNQTIGAGQYLSGAQTIAGDADLVSGNIKDGKNIFGVIGNFAGQYATVNYYANSGQVGQGGNLTINFSISGIGFAPTSMWYVFFTIFTGGNMQFERQPYFTSTKDFTFSGDTASGSINLGTNRFSTRVTAYMSGVLFTAF
ncbi:hypothetical protein [Fusibacter ferrireducens]|uniref:Major tropism determinant N-terminal domain-containing protein n=1 Tax=Fusibacter ferrireducens TaxID=2785058 RepID=A0ABR9ZTU4_9FIRM|nr:hypothetical protein [Fusibacter ferrireducens]MBF4693892.1 hypothetical protein [Fusibacter ferrireducens]